MRSVVEQIISFLGMDSKYSKQEIEELLNQLTLGAMQSKESVDETKLMVKLGIFKANEGSFIRKGKEGGFRKRFGEYVMKGFFSRLFHASEKR